MPAILNKAFDKHCMLYDVKFVENGLFFGNDWEYDDLKAPYNRLYIVLEGEGIVQYDDKQTVIKAGHAYIIPANLSFRCQTPKYLKKIYVHFWFEELFHINVFQHILETPIDIARYEACYEAIENENHHEYYRIKTDFMHMIYAFISRNHIDLFKDYEQTYSPVIVQLHQLLNRELSAKTRTRDLAKQLNISQSMLSKVFKKEMGETLKGFIQQKLIQKAQLLLLTTNKSIKEIAYELHYEDALYFSRVFRNIVGDAPTQYRRKNSFMPIDRVITIR